MDIFVARLSYDTTQDDLESIFEPFGDLNSVRLIRDRESGKSKGFGFVEMPNEEEALTAISHLNETELDGRTIIVKKANPPAGGGGESLQSYSQNPEKASPGKAQDPGKPKKAGPPDGGHKLDPKLERGPDHFHMLDDIGAKEFQRWLEQQEGSFAQLMISIDPGSAPNDEIASLLVEVSGLYRRMGGSGIVFKFDSVTVGQKELHEL